MKHRGGFTIVELLVAVGVIALVMALTLPAVFSARAAARRMECAGRLRQIGIALNNYHSAFDVFPMASGWNGGQGEPYRPRQYSAHCRLIMFMEQNELYNSINFTADLEDFYVFDRSPTGAGANRTVLGCRLAAFLCPADARVGGGAWTGANSYRANLGVETGDVTRPYPGDGPLMSFRNRSYAEVRDGASNTAAFSERSIGAPAGPGRGDLTAMVNLDYNFWLPPDAAARMCAALPQPESTFFTGMGLTWAVGAFSQTNYNHVITPNNIQYDCRTFFSNAIGAIVTARSYHPGGVNVLKVDGSTSFVSGTVALGPWRALGTCAGGEVLDASSY